MEPKDLVAKFAKKTAAAATDREKQKAAGAEHRAARLKRGKDGKKAMAEVVIPYLTEMKAQFPQNAFSFNVMELDADDHKPTGVSFRIGYGPTVTISISFGDVTVAKTGVHGARGVPFVYSPNAEPFISVPNDLTRAKLSKLIEMVLEDA
jgi:hypothetical protein